MLMIHERHKKQLTFSCSFNFSITICRKQNEVLRPPSPQKKAEIRRKAARKLSNLIKLSRQFFLPLSQRQKESDSSGIFFWCFPSRCRAYNILLSSWNNSFARWCHAPPPSRSPKDKTHKILFEGANNNFWWCLSFYDYENLMDEKRFFPPKSFVLEGGELWTFKMMFCFG